MENSINEANKYLGSNTTSSNVDFQGAQDALKEQEGALKALLDQSLSDISKEKAGLKSDFEGIFKDIKSSWKNEKININALLAPMKDQMNENLSMMKTAYNTQIAQQAEQVDAMQASGQLGANSYRAYQIQSQTNRDIMGQAMGQIASFSQHANEALVSASLAGQQANQALYSNTMNTLAGIIDAQSDMMLGYSSLYNNTALAGQRLIADMMAQSMQLLNSQMNYDLTKDKMAMDFYTNLAQTQLGYAQIESDEYLAGKSRSNGGAEYYYTVEGGRMVRHRIQGT